MGEMRDSDWLRRNLLRSDWLLPTVAIHTTVAIRGEDMDIFWNYTYHLKFLRVFTHCW